jgi:hypothetical protein
VACVDGHSVTLRGLSIRAGPAAVGQSVAGGVEAGTRGLDFFYLIKKNNNSVGLKHSPDTG